MEIDRERARAAFDAYVGGFDAGDPKISLKAEHTLRVAQLAEKIARSELRSEVGVGPGADPEASADAGPGADPEASAGAGPGADPEASADLAWLLGLLHDVGRFVQVRTWGTFDDSRSASHADLGARVLFEGFAGAPPAIRDFVEDPSEDDLLRTAVALHSSWHLPPRLDERTRFFCQVLRDADKVDILEVNCVRPVEDIYGISERDLLESELSEESEAWFWRHSTIPRAARHHPADVLLGHVCFVWDLCYPESLRETVRQGNLFRMVERPWERPDTAREFARMDAHLRSWLAAAGYLAAE